MILGYAKMAVAIISIIGIVGGIGYVLKLRSDNAILKANIQLLEDSVAQQKEAIEQQKKDFREIMETNKKLTILSNNLQKE